MIKEKSFLSEANITIAVLMNPVGQYVATHIRLHGPESFVSEIKNITSKLKKPGTSVWWYDGPIPNSMLIGDADSEDSGIIQLELSFPYSDADNRPIIIVRRKNNPILFENLKKQFHAIANKSTPPNNEPSVVPAEGQSQIVAKIDKDETIKITETVRKNEISGEFFNDTGGKLKCSVWVTDLREWTVRFGYLDKQKKLARCSLVQNRTIEPQTRYDTYTKLISRDGRRLLIRGLVDGVFDKEQHFDILSSENTWRLTVEVKTDAELKSVVRKDIFFRCPEEKGLELTLNPEAKPLS